MARKRMLDPHIWESEDFGILSMPERVLFIGMISLADDEGRGNASPTFLNANIFRYDTIEDQQVSSWLGNIQKTMSITIYAINNKRYYQFDHWSEWQTIQKPKPSKIPAPNTNTVPVQYEYSTDTVPVQERYYLNEMNGNEKKRIEVNMNGNEMNDSDRTVPIQYTHSITTPSISDIMEYGSSKGISERVCQEFYDYNSEKGWIFKGEPMENWRTALGAWNRKVKTSSAQNYEQRKTEPGELEKRLCVDLDADI